MPSTLIGQSHVENQLARAIACERVAHAYLFLGPSGCGKTTAARLFARALNCERQPAVVRAGESWRLSPCGECESCRRIIAGTHPEVMEVRPGSKTGQNITVDQAREIRRNAALRPKLGQRRVYLIPKASAFNEESANALLKTLEEPSDFITLLLCAPSPSQVLPTICSRCRMVRFGLAGDEEIAAALTAGGTTPEIAGALARASGGRPGLALSWAREPLVLQTRRRIVDIFVAALAAQRDFGRDASLVVMSLRLAEQLRGVVGQEDRESSPDAPVRPAKALHVDHLETGMELLRDLLLVCQHADPRSLRNPERLEVLQDIGSTTHPRRVLDAIEAVREAQQLLERNVGVSIVLERMFMAIIAGSLPLTEPLFEESAA